MSETERLRAAAADRRVLDPCCGSRMMWFDPEHPDAVFGDRRSETLTVTVVFMRPRNDDTGAA